MSHTYEVDIEAEEGTITACFNAGTDEDFSGAEYTYPEIVSIVNEDGDEVEVSESFYDIVSSKCHSYLQDLKFEVYDELDI